jgi:hypothetical protein
MALLKLVMHLLNDTRQQLYGTHFVEVAVGAYTLAKRYVKVECRHDKVS